MKHTTLWETKTAFDAAKSSLAKPHVSYVREENYVYFIKNKVIPDGFVDLGLPSGILWAQHNLGAEPGSTPESYYGNYYAWGEINQHGGWPEDKTSHPYDWNEYTYAKDDYNRLTKYCTNSEYGDVDNLTTLEPEDDAAYVASNGIWKMPTKEQFEELFINTAPSWQEDYQGITGLSGREFKKILDKPFKNIDLYVPFDEDAQPTQELHLATDDTWNYLAKYAKSELDAMISEATGGDTNDANDVIFKDLAGTLATPGTDFQFSNHTIDTTSPASIFVPAAGCCDGSHLNTVGSEASLWSSSLYTDSPYYAWYLSFNSGKVSMYYYNRCSGCSVRPVLQA